MFQKTHTMLLEGNYRWRKLFIKTDNYCRRNLSKENYSGKEIITCNNGPFLLNHDGGLLVKRPELVRLKYADLPLQG